MTNRKRTIKTALMAAGAFAGWLFMSLPAMAQCAMCKTGVAGSPDAGKLSQSLNFAVLILLIPPVLIFCGMFILAYRNRKTRGTESEPSPLDVKERRNWFAKSGSGRKRKDGSKREAGGATA